MIVSLRNVMPSSASIVLAMIVASAVAMIFNWDRIKDKKELLNKGLGELVWFNTRLAVFIWKI